MKSTVFIKQILIDFIFIREQLKEVFKEEKEYQLIIDFIFAKDYLDNELDIPYPKMKEVEETTGFKPYALRRLLLQIHRLFSFL